MAELYQPIDSRPFIFKSFNYYYMWVVYNYKTREIHFEGTPEQCVEYINNIPGAWNNPVDMMPKKYFNECALPK